jgi:hypothetical protein
VSCPAASATAAHFDEQRAGDLITHGLEQETEDRD